MIDKLRKRFIRITMLSVTGVLVVLMTAINLFNFVSADRSAGQRLELLASGGGAFPAGANEQLPKTADQPMGDQPPAEKSQKKKTEEKKLSPEAPYETRFFCVTLNAAGEATWVKTDYIAAVQPDEAVAMAQGLQAAGKTHGYSGSYKYLAQTLDDGSARYIFLDCTRSLNSFRSFLGISALVSLGGLGAVLLLVVLLSRRAIRPMAESYEKQNQFITDAGHEIKTPLTIIDSCTEVIEMEQGESKWTQGIRGQVRRLTALTASLVSLTRMDEAEGYLDMQELALTEVVDDALEPFTLLAQSRGLALQRELQSDLHLRGNEAALRQLCSILADNAVKYARKDTTISFRLRQKGRRVYLSCENQAEGLTRGSYDWLFDRFYRADASRSQVQGYGIGLSLARAIVTAHGGKISAESPDGASLVVTAVL